MPADIPNRSGVLARMCGALLDGTPEGARAILAADYPFVAVTNAGRTYTKREMMRVFLRDRFTDRYSGARLVFPGTLRLLSKLMPGEFPFHLNWKMSDCHIAYWELFPTVDHVVPVARGGADDESNWVSTSMLRNGAKSNWTLEELGWELRPVPESGDWDGLLSFALTFLERHPEHREDKYIDGWYRAAVAVREATP